MRIKKMEDEGFIKYYQAIPNLSLFGFYLGVTDMPLFECIMIQIFECHFAEYPNIFGIHLMSLLRLGNIKKFIARTGNKFRFCLKFPSNLVP